MVTRLVFLFAGTVSFAGNAAAQSDPNNDLLKLIYTKIVDSIDLRRSKLDDTGGQYFFVLTQPGIFIDPALLKVDKSEDSAQKRVFSEIIDRVMLPSWVYGPTDETYHEYFKLILDTYDYKPLEPTAETKKALEEAKSKTFTDQGEPTEVYAKYLKFEEKYLESLGDADTWLNTHPGAAQLPPLQSAKIKNAMNAWMIAGKKNEIEKALEVSRRYDPAGFWSESQIKYARTTEDLSLHQYYPSIATWLDNANVWPSITVAWSKNESHVHNHHTSASGGGSFSLGGFFNIGHGENYDRIHNTEQNEATSLNVTFEYMRVDFRRPWLTRRVFSDRRWRFECGTDPAIKKWIVSSGPRADVGDQFQFPNGIMPMVPTGFLIARNATVTGDFKEDFREYYKRVFEASGSGGWGPFRVRGSFSDTDEKIDVESQTAKNGFTVGNPQIIGFFVEVLPMSPDPLPGLFEPCKEDGTVNPQ